MNDQEAAARRRIKRRGAAAAITALEAAASRGDADLVDPILDELLGSGRRTLSLPQLEPLARALVRLQRSSEIPRLLRATPRFEPAALGADALATLDVDDPVIAWALPEALGRAVIVQTSDCHTSVGPGDILEIDSGAEGATLDEIPASMRLRSGAWRVAYLFSEAEGLKDQARLRDGLEAFGAALVEASGCALSHEIRAPLEAGVWRLGADRLTKLQRIQRGRAPLDLGAARHLLRALSDREAPMGAWILRSSDSANYSHSREVYGWPDCHLTWTYDAQFMVSYEVKLQLMGLPGGLDLRYESSEDREDDAPSHGLSVRYADEAAFARFLEAYRGWYGASPALQPAGGGIWEGPAALKLPALSEATCAGCACLIYVCDQGEIRGVERRCEACMERNARAR